tara:strand:- start:796 stop:1905 length:1110 start_codon:yes stop_codon:yes gene_type:complete
MIKLSKSSVGKEEKAALSRVISNSYLGMGPEVELFEKELKDYIKTSKKVIAVSSGTAALHLSLQACDINSNHEVLVPSITYVASFQAITASGATPVPCDIDIDTGFIDILDAKKRLSSKTRAIMPVHYASNADQMGKVYEFAKKNNLRVIEDAAHSFGSYFDKYMVGHKGDIICFSFDGIKNITCGEGGAILTGDKKVFSKLRDIRLLGVKGDSARRYSKTRSWQFDVEEQGWRYHLSDLFAAMGREQLKKIDSFKDKRKKVVESYIYNLKKIDGLQLLKINYENNHQHIFPLRVLNKQRDKLKKYLEEKSIQTGFHYQPNHLLSKFKTKYRLKNSEIFGEEILSLPLHPELTKKDINHVINSIKSFFD